MVCVYRCCNAPLWFCMSSHDACQLTAPNLAPVVGQNDRISRLPISFSVRRVAEAASGFVSNPSDKTLCRTRLFDPIIFIL